VALDFRNINSLWASVLVDTLNSLGVSLAAICPGSRSSPLAVAFAQHPQIEAVPILDERSAAFFALGHGKQTGRPAVVVCTSGTAAANFYPAVIEARESRVPLLLLTADRPPELRDCHSGQAIDQLKLYSNYPNWQTELAVPELKLLPYLQQTVAYAWEMTLVPNGGAVQINIPFRDPLPPIADPQMAQLQLEMSPVRPTTIARLNVDAPIPQAWQTDRGLILAGVAQPADPASYAQAVNQIAQTLGWPILAEGLSPLRNYPSNQLISTYDSILRHPHSDLNPQAILQLGDLPTSKELRQWLTKLQPLTWIVEPSLHSNNALHLPANYWRSGVEDLAAALADSFTKRLFQRPPTDNTYLERWLSLEQQTRKEIDLELAAMERLSEMKIPWLLSQQLPAETLLFVANSMPIRDLEFFWKPNEQRYRILGNRGANGIDGTISTALGAMHQSKQPGLLLTGDLSFLHDTNGLLLRQKFRGSLKILLVNNNGGGIFTMLPIANFDPPFQEFFITPQAVSFSQLCAAYQIPYKLISHWADLETSLKNIGSPGVEVWEIATDSQQDAAWRKNNLNRFGQQSTGGYPP
jgi:2-succinyl-5-enolpyruvyl-6-hydroxy-3-cyclohexene-1-carboxylate synthase